MSDVRFKLLEAIVGQRVVAATYNRQEVKLAPHLMFERGGDLFISAVNLNKNRRVDDEPQLGQFKLAGLGAAEVLDENFYPLERFRPQAPREDDTLIMAV